MSSQYKNIKNFLVLKFTFSIFHSTMIQHAHARPTLIWIHKLSQVNCKRVLCAELERTNWKLMGNNIISTCAENRVIWESECTDCASKMHKFSTDIVFHFYCILAHYWRELVWICKWQEQPNFISEKLKFFEVLWKLLF